MITTWRWSAKTVLCCINFTVNTLHCDFCTRCRTSLHKTCSHTTSTVHVKWRAGCVASARLFVRWRHWPSRDLYASGPMRRNGCFRTGLECHTVISGSSWISLSSWLYAYNNKGQFKLVKGVISYKCSIWFAFIDHGHMLMSSLRIGCFMNFYIVSSCSVVVLKESPCLRGSSRTSLQVLVLVLGPQVLVFYFFLVREP